ncbi:MULTISPECIES: flavodoxin domain-containing protein [Micrococcaceae]|uniref:flavodoxin domain-containing protein n=1 Tax=unclassified Kocuria TaxID=2649579 RepID=UPI0010135BCF|nr:MULTISPECIES: flavodoxin domain-containing protein [unclassified Kocuria]
MNVLVLYGTESGNAETVADDIVDEFSDQVDIRAIDMTDAGLEDLALETLCMVVCSTHGEGGLPSSAVPFAELLDAERPELAGMNYAMFGLGDSTYEDTYSQGSEHIDKRLTALGATRIGTYGRHDAGDGSLPNEEALTWAQEVLEEINLKAVA